MVNQELKELLRLSEHIKIMTKGQKSGVDVLTEYIEQSKKHQRHRTMQEFLAEMEAQKAEVPAGQMEIYDYSEYIPDSMKK